MKSVQVAEDRDCKIAQQAASGAGSGNTEGEGLVESFESKLDAPLVGNLRMRWFDPFCFAIASV